MEKNVENEMETLLFSGICGSFPKQGDPKIDPKILYCRFWGPPTWETPNSTVDSRP